MNALEIQIMGTYRAELREVPVPTASRSGRGSCPNFIQRR